MTTFKVMTFNLKNDMFFTRKNLRWDTRRQYVRNLISATSPDIIGVQELTNPMRQQLQQLLPRYDFVGLARNRKRSFLNEHSDILFLRDRFELRHYRTFWLSPHPDRPGSRSWSSLFPRICTMAELRYREDGELIRVFNTHLDPLLAISRNYEITAILREMQSMQQQQACPLILMGDLNTTMSSRTLKKVTQAENQLSLRVVYESGTMFNTLHYGHGRLKENREPIDYIYVNDQLEVLFSRIITTCFNGLYPSDHYPVLCCLQKKGKAEP